MVLTRLRYRHRRKVRGAECFESGGRGVGERALTEVKIKHRPCTVEQQRKPSASYARDSTLRSIILVERQCSTIGIPSNTDNVVRRPRGSIGRWRSVDVLVSTGVITNIGSSTTC